MLKAKNLKGLLSQVLWNGIENAILITSNGTVLSSQSVNESFPASAEHSLLVACVTNIWKAYATNDLGLPENDGFVPDVAQSGTQQSATFGPSRSAADVNALAQSAGCQYVLVTIGDMRVCVVGVAKGEAILCLTANQTVELGMLKLKAGSLQRQLDEPLQLAFGVL